MSSAGEVALAVVIIAVYTVVSISIASVRLFKSYEAKKTG